MSAIYSRQDATSVTAPDGTQYEPDEDGRFQLPEAFAADLVRVHVAGEKAWETEGERQDRLVAEEAKRRSDPATLLAEVEKLGGFAKNDRPEPFSGLSPDDLRELAKAATKRANELDPPPKRKPAARK
jgi:hypothetical protein